MAIRQLSIHGRVQGVGYRDALRRQAERLGVRGWVRNRSDGSVEALVEGSAAALDVLIAWAQRGPPLASVTEVRVADAASDEAVGPGFSMRPTA
jgi:acylphosphatase